MKVEQAIKRALRAGYEEDRQLKLAAYVLATEYTQLRAKLPKTADGVLVVPRMTIWVIYHDKLRRTPHQCVALAVGVERIRVEVLETRERIWVWQSACYSTREAAEAGGRHEHD